MFYPTKEEREIMHAEGWDVTNGTWLRSYWGRFSPKLTMREVHDLVAMRAEAGSEMHRNAFLGSSWNPSDDTCAIENGWRVVAKGNEMAIIRAALPDHRGYRFSSSEVASEFVAAKAREGDLLAMKAVQLITRSRMRAHARHIVPAN